MVLLENIRTQFLVYAVCVQGTDFADYFWLLLVVMNGEHLKSLKI